MIQERRMGERRAGWPEGPTPGAQKELDEHKRLLVIGLRALGGLFFILLAVGTIAFFKIDAAADKAKNAANSSTIAANVATQALDETSQFTIDLRNAAVGGCQRQNKVRKRLREVQEILRDQLRQDIKQTRALTPNDFPSINHFRRLVRDQIARNQRARQRLNHQLELVPCQEEYPGTGDSPVDSHQPR